MCIYQFSSLLVIKLLPKIAKLKTRVTIRSIKDGVSLIFAGHLKISGQFWSLIFKWHLSRLARLNYVGAMHFLLSTVVKYELKFKFGWCNAPLVLDICVCFSRFISAWLTVSEWFCICCVRFVYTRHWHPGCERRHKLWLPEALGDVLASHRSIRSIWTLRHRHQPHHIRWPVSPDSVVFNKQQTWELMIEISRLVTVQGEQWTF